MPNGLILSVFLLGIACYNFKSRVYPSYVCICVIVSLTIREIYTFKRPLHSDLLSSELAIHSELWIKTCFKDPTTADIFGL